MSGTPIPKADRLLTQVNNIKEENTIDVIMDDLEDLADESIEGVERIKTIVNDLKTFSRIDESEHKHIDINKAIDTTLNIINNELKYKVTIEKNYEKIPKIKCFPQKISQVFMNLLINAGQAIEDTGVIKISTREVSIGRREEDRFIEIIISDTGCGIPAENLTRLFDPFFTTKPVGTGTGRGLSIVYEIIKSHKGNIEVNSKLGEGTQFVIYLPEIK